ncbi:hypothetical protein LTR10_011984 [Elasticomyces elasticus]|nr:hypothetical protein LTR10_011984 [Elasticomyces elasticus]KAK4968926.1 hypothetical protein LTR42_009205 [Elasticomyces elasticus]
MAPTKLHGRYKLYKAGTAKLVQWLAKSAESCCDLKTVIKSLDNSNKPKPSRGSCLVNIRTQELVRLAETIAASRPPIAIPESILLITIDVIAGRKECAEWYGAQALEEGSKLDKENKSHQYFILVLQKVLSLLEEARTKIAPKSGASKPSQNSSKKGRITGIQHELSNLFACLEVEEPAAVSVSGATTQSKETGSTSASSAGKSFQLVEDQDDSGFATWSYLQDLDDVRTYLRNTWLEYSRGELSFLAASSITDTAFGLLRCAHEDFEKMVPQCSTAKDLLEFLGLTDFCRGRVVWLGPIANTKTTHRNAQSDDINIVSLLCPVAHRCLITYSQDASAVCEASGPTKRLTPGLQVPRSGFHYHAFCKVLYELAPKLHEIAHSRTCEHIVLDEFVQGLADIHRKNYMPSWMVVACQTYLDIYDLLGTHVFDGAQALQDAMDQNRAVLDSAKAYHYDCVTPMSDVKSSLTELGIAATASGRFEATRFEATTIMQPKEAMQTLESDGEHTRTVSLLERHLPAHAGAILADLKINMHRAGCGVANHGFYILSMVHLYKDLRGSGLLKNDWHDMDIVLAAFGNKQPLVSKTDATYDEDASYRHYLISLGVPATAFAARARRSKVSYTPSLKNARKIGITSPYLRSMGSDYFACEHAYQKHGNHHSKSRTVERVLHALISNDGNPTGNKKQPQIVAATGITPVQLLQVFRKSILADEPTLNFDFVGFTIACARLMNSLVQLAGPRLGVSSSDEWSHITLVTLLLSLPASDQVMADVAHLLAEHIAQQGKKYAKQAYDQSSGRIPKHLRPKISPPDTSLHEFNRELVCSMFDYSDTKYVISGDSLAAYHPSIKFERCGPECKGHGCDAEGAETDPRAVRHGVRIIAYESALPEAIVARGIEKIKKNPKQYLEARDRMVERHRQEHPDETRLKVKHTMVATMAALGWSWRGWAGNEDLELERVFRERDLTRMGAYLMSTYDEMDMWDMQMERFAESFPGYGVLEAI